MHWTSLLAVFFIDWIKREYQSIILDFELHDDDEKDNNSRSHDGNGML